jgi:hypothetical protein
VAIITVERGESDDGYFEMADAMYELAHSQPGFLTWTNLRRAADAGHGERGPCRLGKRRRYGWRCVKPVGMAVVSCARFAVVGGRSGTGNRS